MKKLILLIIILSLFGNSFSQNGNPHFINFNTNTGLPSNTVHSLYVDNQKVAWIGTEEGLCKYNGYEFKIFKPSEHNKYSLSNSVVRYIHFEDSKNNLWLTTNDYKINKFNKKTEIAENYGSKFPELFKIFGYIYNVVETYDTDVWFSSKVGLFRYVRSENKLRKYTNIKDNKNSLSGSIVLKAFVDKNKNLWVGTTNGINKYNFEKDNFKRYNQLEKATSFDAVMYFIEDSKQDLYAVAQKGIYKYSEKNDNFTYFPFPVTTEKPIVKRPYMATLMNVFDDKEKDFIWVASAYGLFRFDKNSNKINAYINDPDDAHSIAHQLANELHKDRNGTLWVATIKGLCEYNYQTDNFTTYLRPVHENYNNEISTISEDHNGNLWLTHNRLKITMGARISLFNIKTKKFKDIKSNPVFPNSIQLEYAGLLQLYGNRILPYKDQFGNIWFNSYTGGTSCMAWQKTNFTSIINDPFEDNPLPKDGIFGICEDDNENVWLSILNLGLVKINHENLKVDKKYTVFSKENKLPGNYIVDINKSKNGNLWMPIYEYGLHKLDIKTEKTERVKLRTDKKNVQLNHINSSCITKNDKLLLVFYFKDIGIYDIKTKELTFFEDSLLSKISYVYRIWADAGQNIWFLGSKGMLKHNTKTHKTILIPIDEEGINGLKNYSISDVFQTEDKNIWFAAQGDGICKLDAKTGKYKYYSEKNGLSNNTTLAILEDKNNNLWISTNNGLSKFNPKTEKFTNYYAKDGLQSNEFSEAFYKSNKTGKFYFAGIGLTSFIPEKVKADSLTPNISLSDFRILEKKVKVLKPNIIFSEKDFEKNQVIALDSNYYTKKVFEYTDTIVLTYKEKTFSFKMTSTGNINPKDNIYKYKLENFDNDWIFSKTRRFVSYTNLPAGEYTFIAYAANSDGVWCENPVKLHIKIYPPWWQTKIAYVAWFILGFLLIFTLIKLRERKLKQQKQALEDTVKQRTAEINLQKEEIQAQADNLQVANIEISKQKEIVEEVHKEITDSINYASRIQRALLPSKELITANFKDHFIFYKPKNVVSGDFYWAKELNDYFVIIAADCTGHGVPGGFLSMLGISFLNEIVRHKDVNTAAQILEELRNSIKKVFKQEETDNKRKEGMDVAVCVINKKTNELQYSGAYNSLYIMVENNPENKSRTSKWTENSKIVLHSAENSISSLFEIKANRQPVAVYAKEKPFLNHIIQLKENDIVYLFSDGYIDQFGGDKVEKFKIKRFRDLINAVQNKDLNRQKDILVSIFKKWKGNNEQIDDVLVMGLKI